MSGLKCLILGDDFTPARTFEEALREGLQAHGRHLDCESVDFEPHELTRTPTDELHEAFGDVGKVVRLVAESQLLITTFAPVTAAVLDSAPGLLAIACGRGGPVNVNVEAATARGIPVLYAPGRNARAVAEFTLAGMINLMRRIPEALHYVRDGRWLVPREDTFEKPTGPELGGRTLGLIGCGHVGRLVGRLAGAFGARVVAHDPFVAETVLTPLGIEPVPLERLLAESDLISVHARLPEGSPPILDAAAFAAMTRRPYLINTARASAIDHRALLAALRSGRVTAALLDVHGEEPLPPGDPLLSFDPARLLLTPHSAGVSRDIPANTARLVADGLIRLLCGEAPDHVTNPQCLESCFQRLG